MSRYLIASLTLLLCACTTMMGPPYVPGVTTQAEVLARRGPPAMQWQEKDGSTLYAYPTGPNGTSTIMARFDARQRLQRYEEVLNNENFVLLQAGMSMDEVQRIIGPPYHPWTVYFKARDELVWEWRYCDAWGEAARFNVFFDGTTKRMRSTMGMPEKQHFGGFSRYCAQTYVHIGSPTRP